MFYLFAIFDLKERKLHIAYLLLSWVMESNYKKVCQMITGHLAFLWIYIYIIAVYLFFFFQLVVFLFCFVLVLCFKGTYSDPTASLVAQMVKNVPTMHILIVSGLIPGLGRSLGEENGYLIHCSCLENSMDRGAWRFTVHGVTKSQTWLSN